METVYERDLRERMYMHIGSCAECGACLMENRVMSCQYGRDIAYRWLEFRHKHGDKSATYILDQLKATGARRR